MAAAARPGRPPIPWWGTLLYPATLVALFLGCQGLAGLVGIGEGQRASLAAIPAVLALVVSLPQRLKRQWGEADPWRSLGVVGPWPAALQALLRGLLKAAALLALVVIGLQSAGALSWPLQTSAAVLLNGLVLALGVGFAEELLFRGWLLGELGLQLGRQRALWLQAALFSLVHTRFNLPLLPLLGLLGGLLLLGLALGLQRRSDGGLLWGALGLHGGLVGGWFVLNQGLIALQPGTPSWLSGPANPIGGGLGWLGLGLLLWARRRWWSA
ncbi:MAG: CPBP family intramembrane metalloprotease [Synechococcus sp. Baikal-G1]|nr:MAG: CPBP family intramembrane metalloprotease [Synechococcus sp. Baikal-G1]